MGRAALRGPAERDLVAKIREARGKLEAVQAAARNVTDRKAAEAAREVADQHFRTAFDDAPIGMALVAPTGGFLRVNQALCTSLGYSSESLLSSTFQDLTHPDDLAMDEELLRETLEGARTTYQMEKRYLRADGAVVWALLSVSLVRDEQGAPLHFISQIQDISARKVLEQELHRLATRDDLTGLLNRRAFNAELERQLARRDEAAVLLTFDLDDFKAVNDRFGHHVGDAVLRHAAQALRSGVTRRDVVARLGGDEFAVLLRDTEVLDARALAARVHAGLDEALVDVDGHAIPVGVSSGVAELDRGGDAGATMRAADADMYAAKRRRKAREPVVLEVWGCAAPRGCGRLGPWTPSPSSTRRPPPRPSPCRTRSCSRSPCAG